MSHFLKIKKQALGARDYACFMDFLSIEALLSVSAHLESVYDIWSVLA
jgi:hypothetical protein